MRLFRFGDNFMISKLLLRPQSYSQLSQIILFHSKFWIEKNVRKNEQYLRKQKIIHSKSILFAHFIRKM